jgi:hypothetical protein
MTISESDITDDVVWGARAIGRVIRKNPRQAFYLLESGLLPARKIGNQWCASRSRLLRAVTGDDGPGVAA